MSKDNSPEQALGLKDFDIKKVEVKIEDVQAYKSEDQFTGLAVELLKEAGKMISIVACAYRLDDVNRPRKWKRNEAILGGLAIRLSKLLQGILDQTCQNRREIAEILFRCLAETAINLKYLIKESSGKAFEEYVEYSLREEKRLLSHIEENITNRGGEFPIETRMKKSILMAFKNSGVSPEQVDEKNRTPWGESIFKRTKRIGLKDIYGLISMASHSVHGNWQDLISHHLEKDDDGFMPETRWTRARPQYLLVAALLSLDACETYISNLLPDCPDRTEVQKRISDCLRRVLEVDSLHENFLTSGIKKGQSELNK